MRSLVLVTGGTGRLGAHVVRGLTERGCKVRVLSRKQLEGNDRVEYVAGDLVKAIGVDEAVAGAVAIVHCASARKGDDTATLNLVKAAAAGTPLPHLVFVSIVGVDGIPYSYFQTKLTCERIVKASGLPWTIQRATQFYDFILNGAKSTTWLPIVPVPKQFRVQPIDPAEVGAKLVDLALGPPSGRVPDIGGPNVSTWAQMVRQYLQATNRRRVVVELPMPMTRQIRAGGLLVGAGAGGTMLLPYGKTTWAEFLQRRLN